MIRHGVAKGAVPEDQKEVDAFRAVDAMDECVEKYRQMVVLNPDDYRCWNLLKRHFLETKSDDVFKDQLLLTQKAIEANPKCYFAWHHRAFLFKHRDGNLDYEKKLCSLLLVFDSRNFHCWNYCRAQGLKMPLDFSNYSSMYGHFTAGEEAVYTDPDDEGAWRYFNKIQESKRGPLYARSGDGCLEVVFRDPFAGVLRVDGEEFVVRNYVGWYRCSLQPAAQRDSTLCYRASRCGLAGTDGRGGVPEDPQHPADVRVQADGQEYLLGPEEEPGLVRKILELSPRCVFALKERLKYTEDIFERKRLAKELGKADPLRRSYYDSLVGRYSKIYAISEHPRDQ